MLAAEKERKAGKPGRGSPVLAVMMRKIFVWRAMERRAKERASRLRAHNREQREKGRLSL